MLIDREKVYLFPINISHDQKKKKLTIFNCYHIIVVHQKKIEYNQDDKVHKKAKGENVILIS
ncbi:hypothetical protein BDC45DRAFT_500296 [Circinella umbellata]|nr:hypothetical protein BDC45DRAFT_500296 [Circinella umbellata]